MPETAAGEPSGHDPVPAAFRATIGEILESFVGDQGRALAPLGPDLEPLLEIARRAVTGGKCLRAAFAYWGWRAAGGSAAKSAALMRAAAAIELVHASALIHDDVMDASATRRGNPSAHRAFAAMRATEAPVGAADRFGTSAAILLGDLLLAWSDEMFGESGFRPKAIRRGRVYFDKLRREVVAGQYLDVLAQTRRRTSASDAMRVLLYKSAKYTVERPLQLGAALGKAGPELLTALSSYGVPLGEAFQLRDDVLGVFGEASLTGKPSGDDLREGKRTLLVARAYDKADAKQHAVLDAALGNARLEERGIAAVQDVLSASGALGAVETVIDELTSAARASLRQAPIEDDEARTALLTLTDHATNRSV
ncbi:MAG: polyprenyl synthetase family protein [Nocardioidaceae bacterium]